MNLLHATAYACHTRSIRHTSQALEDIEVAESVTWYSIAELTASLARVLDSLRFEWLLPGHGDRKHLSAEEMTHRLRALATRVSALDPQPIDFTAVRW